MHNSFTALADPTRRRIVEALSEGPLSSGDIASLFAISAPAVSQHLKTLRQARLVFVHIKGQRRIYELDRQGIDEMGDWVSQIRQYWETKLDALQGQLEKELSHE
jgi:DNA-binding transcriptional ArsR family regulator